MPKQITPDQALALSFSPFRCRTPMFKHGRVVRDDNGETVYELAEVQRFIKPGETQASALKRLRNHKLGRTKQADATLHIPAFVPGVTSTAAYVAQFESMNFLRATGSAVHLTHPAPLYETPDVVVNDYADDLV